MRVCVCLALYRCWRHSLNSTWIVSKRRIVKRSFGGYSRVVHRCTLRTNTAFPWRRRATRTFPNCGLPGISKLKGAPEGPERQKLWDELQKFIIVEGKEEGDDDDMDKDDQS